MKRPTDFVKCAYDALDVAALDELAADWRLTPKDIQEEVTAAHRHLYAAYLAASRRRGGDRRVPAQIEAVLVSIMGVLITTGAAE